MKLANGNCMTVNGNGMGNGVAVIEQACSGLTYQKWTVVGGNTVGSITTTFTLLNNIFLTVAARAGSNQECLLRVVSDWEFVGTRLDSEHLCTQCQ